MRHQQVFETHSRDMVGRGWGDIWNGFVVATCIRVQDVWHSIHLLLTQTIYFYYAEKVATTIVHIHMSMPTNFPSKYNLSQ